MNISIIITIGIQSIDGGSFCYDIYLDNQAKLARLKVFCILTRFFYSLSLTL